MDLLVDYGEDDMVEEGGKEAEEGKATAKSSSSSPSSSCESSPIRMLAPKSSAHPVDATFLALGPALGASGHASSGALSDPLSRPIDPAQRKLLFNASYDQLWAPIVGPAHPFSKDGIAQGMRNHKLGFVEDASISSFMFDEQYNTFHKFGYAVDPSASADASGIVGNVEEAKRNAGTTVFNVPQQEQRKRKAEKKLERKEEDAENDSESNSQNDENPDEEVSNPASDAWIRRNRKSPWSGKKEGLQGELTEEQKKYAEEYALKKGEKEKGESTELPDKSTFHGKDEHDYQGRSWINPPTEVKKTNDHCYIPKRCIHTWSGHTKGVSAIRFFPKYGHLLLSGSMDTKVKIWDVHGSGKCMRTYMGHSKAVKDISFSNDGSRFLSAGYDRKIKLWDTESGKVISSFSTGKIPYVVKLHPDEDKQNILLAGMSDKKIVQWDMNSGEITQEYDQHLGAVNTITFVDNNRRFVTSSDDKSLRVWEYGIPVVIKYISEPHMHSMPSISVHPSNSWLAAQSLDNQILIYSTRERFRLNKKKRFAGHIVAGYACQVNFSPDGRFIMSGDGEGRCWFWDWKTCKVFRTLKCHEGVCIGCEWHPLEQSKVATCGWDGQIKYWD